MFKNKKKSFFNKKLIYYLNEIQKNIYKTDYSYSEEISKNITIILNEYNDYISSNDSLNIFTNKINEYSTFYDSILLNSLKKIDNKKYKEYIFLSTDIMKNNIETAKKLQKMFDTIIIKEIMVENITSKKEKSELTSQIEAIPKYLSYAYSEKAKVSLNEAYENSTIKNVSDLGLGIINTLVNIDKIYTMENSVSLHEKNANDFGILSVNIRDIADSELKFKKLISMLYTGLYEFTNHGKNNTLYELARKFNVDTLGLDLIKWYRAMDEHSTDKTDKTKIKKIYDFNTNVINKKIPEKPSDYLKLQQALYEKILEMLNQIFEQMN